MWKKLMIGLICLVGIVVILNSIPEVGRKGTKALPAAEGGTLNLTQWNFKDDGNVKLDGEWDFYWNKLIGYEELPVNKPDFSIFVPEVWNKYKVSNKKLPGMGVATYSLIVNTNLPKGTLLGIRLNTISSAYKMFINDELILSVGKVGKNEDEEKGEYNPQMVIFAVPEKQFNIIIQVSNFHYARGGIWNSIYLGEANSMQKLDNVIFAKEIFLLGIFLIIALFCLSIFFLLRELRYALYFSLICIFGAIATDTVGEFIIINSSFSFETVVFVWYSVTNWLVLFLILFMSELFPSRFSNFISKVYFAIAATFQVFFVFVNTSYYTRLGNVNNLIETMGVFSVLMIIVVGATQGHKNWMINIFSIAALLITYVHDILYWTNIIQDRHGEIFYIGVFVSIFLQMLHQAQKVRVHFDNKSATELLFLQAQIKPHFLYNTINTIISISRFDMEKARELLIEFSQYLRKSFDFKSSEQLVPLKSEIELAKAYIAIEKARFGDRLEVNFEVQDQIQAMVPILVLQPIIENAVIHGVLQKPEGGRIDVSIKSDGKVLAFSVKDNGVGIKKEYIEIITKGKSKSIGLSNIDLRMRKLYKHGININSEINIGTEVKWCIFIKDKGRLFI
jgi:sensor histidine kinase YesM